MDRFHFTAFSSSVMKGSRDPRPWRNTTYWLVPRVLLSLLFYTTQDHLPRGGPIQQAGYPISIIDQENAPHICSQAGLVEVSS